MFRFCGVFILVGIISVANADVSSEINSFRIQSLSNIQQQFNNLFNDVYGHFHRSQTTLRAARQNLYTAASTFPYYRLSETVRKNLVANLGTLTYNTIDPVIESVQKTAMTKLYAFNVDAKSVTEQAFSAVETQINAAVMENCTAGITSRKLATEYTNFIASINNCTRVVFQKFRDPIGEFTRVHFAALPLINRIVRELNTCTGAFNINRIESCIADYLKNNCQDDSCKVISTINAVKDQAEKMIVDGRAQYDDCLTNLKGLPENPSFLKDPSCNTTS